MHGARMFAKTLAALLLFSVSATALEIQWQPHDFQAAAAKAGREGKLVYIFVEGDNCPPCDAFKASHLSDPAYADFVNTLYVPIRASASLPEGQEFLHSLNLNHAAVPRFYVLTPQGRGVSMSIGMVTAPPEGAAEVLKLASGRELPVDKNKAAQLAGRLRQHAASERSSGALHPENPLRYLGLAILEAQAWALAGRLDEAEKAFGAPWADQLADQEIRARYVDFWLSWNRNPQGAFRAAVNFRNANPDDPAGLWLVARSLAANGRYAEAVREGEAYLQFDQGNEAIGKEVARWRQQM